MGSLQPIDVIIIFVYIIGCIAVGFYRAKHITNIREYTLGPGRFHDIVIVSTIFATSISAGVTIGTIEKIYTYGVFFAITRIIAPLFWFIMLKVYAEHIEQFRGCLSISDIMQKLYGTTGRWVTNVAAVLMGIGAVASQAAAMGYVLNYFLDLPYTQSLYISLFIMVVYSALGGIRAVAFTDVFQLCVFIIAIPMACSVAYHNVGGYQAIIDHTPDNLLKLDLNASNIWLFLSLIFYSLMPVAEGAYIQRFLMTYDKIQLIKSLKVVMILSVPFTVVICLIGFIIRVKAPEIEPSLGFIHFIANYMTAGTKGLVIAGLLAIIMSSADSWLNYASVLCAHDIVKKVFTHITAKQELLVARISAIFIGILAAFLALSENSVLSLTWIADNFWQPVTLIPLAAGFLGLRTNSFSFLISSIVAVLCTLLTGYLVDEFATISLVSGISGSGLGLFATHYWQKCKKKLTFSQFDSEKAQAHTKIIVRSNEKSSSKVKRAYNDIFSFIRHQVETNGTKNYSFSLFIIINYFIPLLIINISGNFLHDSIIYLRVIAIILCLGLLFLEYWPREVKTRYYPFYWYFCLFFCIPFTASYTIFITYTSEFWLLNATISIILLFIITDWISFAVLMFVGCVLGYLLYLGLSYNTNTYYTHSGDILLLFYLYGFLLIIMFLFVRDKEKIQEKRLEHMELFGGAIAHEVNTPIATIQIIAMTLSDLATSTSKGAKPVKNEDGSLSYQLTLPEVEYKLIFDNLPHDLVKTSKEAKKVIDVLLMLLKHRGSEYNAVYSMGDIIKDMLSDYSAEPEKISRVIFRKNNDFKFFGTKQYIKQVLKNLLNNAFNYAGEDAKINIWIEGNSVHIKDNGIGIEPEYMKNLFKPFQEKGTKGTGIGLAFCGILIHNMGGTIECTSEYGKYTEFIITLPAVR